MKKAFSLLLVLIIPALAFGAGDSKIPIEDRIIDFERRVLWEAVLKKQTDARKVLVLSDSFDENTYKSARNLKPVLLATAADVNAEQILAFEKILVTPAALEKLAQRTKAPSPGASRPPLPKKEGRVRANAKVEDSGSTDGDGK